jgi:hypothetical protein
MPAPQALRRTLPANPSREHLRKQAKRLAKAHKLQLAAAQRRLAGEYGYTSWAALMRTINGAGPAPVVSPLSLAAARADEAAVRELLLRGDPVHGHNMRSIRRCGVSAPATHLHQHASRSQRCC